MAGTSMTGMCCIHNACSKCPCCFFCAHPLAFIHSVERKLLLLAQRHQQTPVLPIDFALLRQVCITRTPSVSRYWDFTMSHRWDSHWKKHGRTGPSPFAATPSHREQWQAQLIKLKQKAAYRRAHQQATEHPEHAGEQHDQPHWQPQQQSGQQTQAGQQHSRNRQQDTIPETDLKAHQHAVSAEALGTEALGTQFWHDIRDWLSSQGWEEDLYPAEVQPAVGGHAPANQYSQHTAVREHATRLHMPTPSFKGQSTGIRPNVSTRAVEPEDCMPTSSLLMALLTHQLLQQLQQREHSFEWAVNLNSMMGAAALQHVQSMRTTFHNGSSPWGDVLPTEDPSVAAPGATGDVTLVGLDSDVVSIHSETPAAQEQAGVHKQMYARTRGNSIPASDKEDPAAETYQSKTKGSSGGHTQFQTQHTQVQSQLAGLKRRAARKHGV